MARIVDVTEASDDEHVDEVPLELVEPRASR
jgi:hypothetical protein